VNKEKTNEANRANIPRAIILDSLKGLAFQVLKEKIKEEIANIASSSFLVVME